MSERSEKLLDAIGMVSDEHVEEAHGPEAGADGDAGTGAEGAASPQAKRTSWRRRALAAAACLVVVVGVGALTLFGLNPAGGGDKSADVLVESVAETEESAEVVSVDSYDSATGSIMALESSADGAVTTMKTMADASSPLVAGSVTAGAGDFDYDSDYEDAEAGLLTAAEWNDNDNWPFFTNLVNAGTISFPSFGIDPRHRVHVSVADESGASLRGEHVVLRDGDGSELWHATTDKNGDAYLFYAEGASPASVAAPDSGVEQAVAKAKADQQSGSVSRPSDDVALVIPSATATFSGDVQVMFIVDTTGSMSDEIAYLQADFASIAADVGGEGVSYSANFYRDEGEDEEYVTKCNPFTSDVSAVQRQLNDEYADGGGDEPEAVAQILAETITDNGAWRDEAAKVAFLVFDAPPHEGTDASLDAAVRSAASRGIHIVPVVASNASRDTELFGRALAICTDAPYVFLTDDSGIGDAHLEPIVGDYEVEPLHDIIVRIIQEQR